MPDRQAILSGTPWEDLVGYARAVRIGNLIEVAGTTAMEGDAVVAPGDPYGQTRFILEKIQQALEQAGGRMADVIRTRLYVTDISQWEAIGRAHGEFFREIKPAATMVQVAALIDPALVVEIEATAIMI